MIPGGEHSIRASELLTNVDYNPYEGFPITGSIRRVYLRGRLAVEDGRVLEENGGQYLHRGLPLLF